MESFRPKRPERPKIDQGKVLMKMLPWAIVITLLLLLWEWYQGRI
jgi:hypothetical protein